ncbi:plasmid stabilization protein [Paraburkholderia fungorum]|uniref:Plasmid stabilization protein n=1 Tax=Paraburkholderia fungorum TaxID=134537 RepID=A0A420GV06_9BURK|nr:plasmid stabilization protein [Paraburkholderia fungorum]RKF48933.1 plasmid stabilization protein [Paraburkholderia fungorum]
MATRARLCVDLGRAKSRWEAWCALHGVTAADGVRQLVHGVLSQHESPDGVRGPEHRCLAVDGHRERIEIRLTQEELEVTRQRALTGGMNVNRWIVAVIRAQLVHEPQLGEREMRLLADSNQHLAMIVMLLGRLQTHGGARDTVRVFEDTRAVIDTHLRTVTQVLRANLDRWSR